MRILVGTSGFSYAPWRGRFYPKELPASEWLGYYAGRLPTVEINNTFYRLPSPELLERWARQVPGDFVFSLKAPRRITHLARLVGVAELLERFLAGAAALGPRLGPVLFQLPPSLRADPDLLEGFLELLPQGLAAAFELRHRSWLEDPRVPGLLRAHGKALCLAETDESSPPLVATASYGYLRLRRTGYGPGDLEAWAARIRAQPWTHAFVYFKHEDEALGPAFAAQLASLLQAPAPPPGELPAP